MPGLKRIISAADPAERKRRRATLGGLHELKASKAAQRRYDVAVNYFLWVSIYLHGHLARSDEELDQHCAEFLKLCWSEGEPRWLAADCISGLQYKLQRKRLFPVSWNYLSIWDKYELPQRASPVSVGQVMAISGMAFYFGLYEFGVVVALAFSGMLRTAEIWELRGTHISFEPRKLAMMLMSKTGNRTGHPETVVVDDFLTVQLVRWLMRSKSPMDRLFSENSATFRRLWKWSIEALKLDPRRFQPYGLRRGGACEDWALFMDAGRLCMRGRWQSIKTAKIYAQEALRLREQSLLSQEHKDLVSHWAKVFKFYVQGL